MNLSFKPSTQFLHSLQLLDLWVGSKVSLDQYFSNFIILVKETLSYQGQ